MGEGLAREKMIKKTLAIGPHEEQSRRQNGNPTPREPLQLRAGAPTMKMINQDGDSPTPIISCDSGMRLRRERVRDLPLGLARGADHQVREEGGRLEVLRNRP